MALAKPTEFISNADDFWWRVYAVLRLFFSRRPTTVFWCVVSVIVVSFYCVFPAWAFAHVGEEISEFHPAFADPNTSSTIPMVVSGLRVDGALFHRTPRSVSDAHLAVVARRMTVFSDDFTLKASARSLTFRYEVMCPNPASVTTITLAQPSASLSRWFLKVSVKSNDDESSKSFPNELKWFHNSKISPLGDKVISHG